MQDKILNDRYKIIKELGKGGMAIVYEATDLLLDRKVALKMLRPEYVNDRDFVRRFRHEAKAVARLSHPSVVNIFDIGQDGKQHFLVMEDVEGRNLKDIIKERGRLTITESLDIANQICAALVVAHRNNIVHCDIKPHNILLTPENQVKVTDFGIARAVTSSTMTLTNTIVGSAHYFSPEQARGGEIRSHSDIYSLGVVLYEMLTGEVPFKGDSPISVALKHIQEKPRRPSRLNQEITPEVEKLVLKALAKEAEERFSNAAEMRENITRILKGINRAGESADTDMEDTKILKRVELPGKEKQERQKAGNEYRRKGGYPSREKEYLSEKGHRSEKGYLTEKETKRDVPRWLKWLLGILALMVIISAGAFFYYQNYMDVPVVQVPDLVGMEFNEARKLAAQTGLHLEKQNEGVHHPQIPEGSIISQYPTGGERVRQTRAILVTLSKGPAILTAPDLTNLTLREAEVVLSNNKLLTGEMEYSYSEEVAQGRVISQKPEPGEEITSESGINLVISQGPRPRMLPMPNLIGLFREEARLKLQGMGLKVGETAERYTTRFKEGQVAEQEYEAGRELPENSPVNLTISRGLINKNNSSIQTFIVRSVTINEEPAEQRIQIIVTDDNGRDVVFDQILHPGDNWQDLTINSVGPTRVEVFRNGELIGERQIG